MKERQYPFIPISRSVPLVSSRRRTVMRWFFTAMSVLCVAVPILDGNWWGLVLGVIGGIITVLAVLLLNECFSFLWLEWWNIPERITAYVIVLSPLYVGIAVFAASYFFAFPPLFPLRQIGTAQHFVTTRAGVLIAYGRPPVFHIPLLHRHFWYERMQVRTVERVGYAFVFVYALDFNQFVGHQGHKQTSRRRFDAVIDAELSRLAEAMYPILWTATHEVVAEELRQQLQGFGILMKSVDFQWRSVPKKI